MPEDTAPIRPEERFDERAVARYLREVLPDLVGDAPIEFAQFPGGAANLTYLARAGDVELVLRRPPHGPVARGGHDMAREFTVLSRLWPAYPKAPRALAYCDDPDVMGKPFFVMERRVGWVIRDRLPEPFVDDHAVQRRLALDLVDTLAELHRVDPAEVGLDELGRPDGFVERQISGWERRWQAAATEEVPIMEALVRELATTIPRPQTAALLHNDYKLDNTMVDDEGAVVAVFDWDMATRGDPLVDLGTFLAYWADPESPTYPVFGPGAVTLAHLVDHDEIVARYAAATDLDVHDVAFFEALALFRIAVIIEQIYARYVARQTSDERFAQFGGLAALLAGAAMERLAGR